MRMTFNQPQTCEVSVFLCSVILCEQLLWKVFIWVCLKIWYIPNYSHLIGIMIINHWD